MKHFLVCWLAMLALAGCGTASSPGPTGRDIARRAAEAAFEIVDIDGAVLAAVLAQGEPGFPAPFRDYKPPAEPKIALGDKLSVTIWEAPGTGLFGGASPEPVRLTSADAGLSGQMAGGLALLEAADRGAARAPDVSRQSRGISALPQFAEAFASRSIALIT